MRTFNAYPVTKWEIERMGCLTSSEASDWVIDPVKAKDIEDGLISVSTANYVLKCAAEVISGTYRSTSVASMDWGHQYEPVVGGILKELYPGFEYFGGDNPQFFKYTDFSGGSPDGFIRKKRVVAEIKCPEDPAVHLAYCLLLTQEEFKKARKDYYYQVQMNMAVMAKYWKIRFESMRGLFVSYSPLIKEPFTQLFQLQIKPDLAFYEKLNRVLPIAEEEYRRLIRALKQK